MKTALITGAAGGIGAALCASFRRAGYRVVGIDRLVALSDNGADMVSCDLSQLSDRQRRETLAAELAGRLNGTLDVLVNNAAVQIVKPFERLDAADWTASLNVNVLAPFWLVQSLAPLLRRASGSVVNIASIHSDLTKAGFLAYSTTKGALVALTRALALELAPEVRVNAILPAATDTAMLRAGFQGQESMLERLASCHPMRRIGRPEEVAALAVFLSSSENGFLTGEAIRIDGGIGAVLHDPASDAHVLR